MTEDGIHFEKKKIHDSVHGTISLSEVEVEIINSKSFQRLRNIKQLGLANYVFPGADYTRFSHSLGVCHLTGKMYDAYSKATKAKNDFNKQEFRLAGLLHDIGHYPFSHAMEEAIKTYSDSKQKGFYEYVDSELTHDGSEAEITPRMKTLDHESVGREVLMNDTEIAAILGKYGFKANDIYNLFTREGAETEEKNITNLVSSDFDADRLDYLLRSACHIGLPYGSTDVEYLLTQIRIDNDRKICMSHKALRSIDHFLLCRFFDYSQVVYHKTVIGFEEILKQVITYIVEKGIIGDVSTDGIRQKIKSGSWYGFDEAYMLNVIRAEYEKKTASKNIMLKMNSILYRRPPKQIIKYEVIQKSDADIIKEMNRNISDIQKLREKISGTFGIDADNIIIWSNIKHPLEVTKVGKTIPVSEIKHDKKDSDKMKQRILIHNPITGKSTPIMDRKDSLMSILADYRLYSIRLFVLFDEDKNEKSKLGQIEQLAYKECPYLTEAVDNDFCFVN